MTVELIISIIALALAVLAAVRTFGLWTFFSRQKAKNAPEVEVQRKVKKEGLESHHRCDGPPPFNKGGKEPRNEDIFKKTLQSIEDYRKHR